MSLLRVSLFRDLHATDRLCSTIHYITLVTSLLLFKLVFCYVSIDRFRSFVQNVFLLAFINKCFSSRQKLHRFDPALYAATCFIMDHLMWCFRFPIFNFQICFDNSVSLEYFTYRKDLVWLRHVRYVSISIHWG